MINRCYWPLLNLVGDLQLPIGIEASAYTLEIIATLDPSWISELQRLCSEGNCEFIGSGYTQLIGPLVPAQVNRENHRVGLETYERLLGFRPNIALVSEQAYSSGLVQHYTEAGYQAIVVEWDNPYSVHPEWSAEWRYRPQFACDHHGRKIPVIWNHSIPFQKFQRYAHGEMELDAYIEHLSTHIGSRPRALCIYGNDAEVFDFRPGRFHTEARLTVDSEWGRIRRLYEALQADPRFELVSPGQVLDLMEEPEAGKNLYLETATQPIPTKKQHKYNVTRWAVTGRNDLGINTACWRAYKALVRQGSGVGSNEWRELCYLWSSDFRTHITQKRWSDYLARLDDFERRVGSQKNHSSPADRARDGTAASLRPRPQRFSGKRYLRLDTPHVRLHLDTWKGMAFESLWFPHTCDLPLCKTVPHGFFDDIGWGADFFSGHLVLELPGRPKITDLEPVEPRIFDSADQAWIKIEARIGTPLGPIEKTVRVSKTRPSVELTYRLLWPDIPTGSLRLGHVTINPVVFDPDTLAYSTNNGGDLPEHFPLGPDPVGHGEPVSFLVSARQCLGLTGGWLEIGDRHRGLRIQVDPAEAAVVGMIMFRMIKKTYLCRMVLSAAELDETRNTSDEGAHLTPRFFRLSITPTLAPAAAQRLEHNLEKPL